MLRRRQSSPNSIARWPSRVRPSAETSAGRRASAAAAVITEASTGIGFELARIAAGRGYDLVVAADEAAIADVVARPDGRIAVSRVEADLSAVTGVDHLIAAIGGRPVDVLCANGGIALGHAFSTSRWRRGGTSSIHYRHAAVAPCRAAADDRSGDRQGPGYRIDQRFDAGAISCGL
jgi:NAD(P)-dependent dehydrogenase (short-subunit alcohol dehydrogenase family)